MNVCTILRFLVGRRTAIERIAACPRAVFVGLLFVLSAGLAREYDGEDLLAQPYHAVLPLVASLGTSFVLYVLLGVVAQCLKRPGQWWLGYSRFLGLYWMTAPLAWVYAVPVERFLPPFEATVANLDLLAFVSLWRVALMIRVVSVLFRAPPWAATMVVMLFADAVAVAAVTLVPHPIMWVMGGVRLTPSEAIIASTSLTVQIWGAALLPVWLIGTSTVLALSRMTWPDWRSIGAIEPSDAASNCHSRPRVDWSAWVAAWALVTAGVALLPVAQSEQRRRTVAEQMLRSGDVDEAVRYMAQFDRDDFPPHWDPPPRLGYGTKNPPLIDVLQSLVGNDAPEWLWETYRPKFAVALEGWRRTALVDVKYVPEFDRWMTVLEAMPDQRSFAVDNQGVLRGFAKLQLASADTAQAERFRSWMLRNGLDAPHWEPPSTTHREASE